MTQEQAGASGDTALPDTPALLVPAGVHADGTPCWHGIAENEVQAGLWATCRDGQEIQVEAAPGSPQLGKDGWELTATPCPDCGAADEVLVRHGAQGPEGPWVWHCPVCKASGTGHPRTEPA
jgi:hypothetical protein